MATGIKYALLLLPTHFDYETGVRQLLPDMTSWRGKVSDLIDAAEVNGWKQSLGELEWRFFEDEERIVFVSMPSQAADVIDGETEQLKGRLGLAANAMLLSGPDSPYSGVARCVYGEALTVAPTIRLKTIRGQFPLEHRSD